MSDYKNARYADRTSLGYERRLGRVTGAAGGAKVTSMSNDVGSWDAYKNWLTKVQAPDQQRNLPDVALFSWKGYRSWAEKVRRDWDNTD
jgi:hypothetical protein|tara:strand:+ start:272 stop:538 length:267 start_codon:yes stop_codon:yes gene_type:complete